MPKRSLLASLSAYLLVICLSLGSIYYYQGEIKRIEAGIQEETVLQEGEHAFLQSGNFQFVKGLDEEVLDVEGMYHVVVGSIADTPLSIVSTHKEDISIDIVLQGTTLDMLQWMVSTQNKHPTIRFGIEKIIHSQGVTHFQCKISENTKK